jgi:hypothetical protein
MTSQWTTWNTYAGPRWFIAGPSGWLVSVPPEALVHRRGSIVDGLLAARRGLLWMATVDRR